MLLLAPSLTTLASLLPHPCLGPHPSPPPAGTKMDEPLGWAHTPLDARFDTVRAAESNIGGMFADIMRISLGADAAFFNGGTIRSDQVRAAAAAAAPSIQPASQPASRPACAHTQPPAYPQPLRDL